MGRNHSENKVFKPLLA